MERQSLIYQPDQFISALLCTLFHQTKYPVNSKLYTGVPQYVVSSMQRKPNGAEIYTCLT